MYTCNKWFGQTIRYPDKTAFSSRASEDEKTVVISISGYFETPAWNYNPDRNRLNLGFILESRIKRIWEKWIPHCLHRT
jgi:hypothetical protein